MDIEPRPRALGEYLTFLTEDQSRNFALALGGEHNWRNVVDLPELARTHNSTAKLIDRVLSAANHASTTKTTTAIVENLLPQIVPTDFKVDGRTGKQPLSPRNVAAAIAYLRYPENQKEHPENASMPDPKCSAWKIF